MNRLLVLIFLIAFIQSCHKDGQDDDSCDMQTVYEQNEAKVTITNGVWGTVAFTEGNCMPIFVPGECKGCPIRRKVRIYEYTILKQANPSKTTRFYNSFSTNLIKEVESDHNGFFQTELPAGDYTIVVVENGRLYANHFDGWGGISPFKHGSGPTLVNVNLTYKAVF